MCYLLLIIGFFLLIKGADMFVEGSSNIAKFLKVPSIIIGLTLVAFGTSAPEAAVSITASLKNSSSLSVSNIIGSNIFNLFVVLGFTALFKGVKTTKNVIKKDYTLSIISIILLLFLASTTYFVDGHLYLTRIDGVILIFILLFYIGGMIKSVGNKDKEITKHNFSFKDILYILLGLSFIIWGGNLTVSSACTIARKLGLSERVIGLSIVAVGTSLPEFCTSLMALIKGENDIAVGNVIGSNIFNVLFILGVSSLIRPLMISMDSFMDIMVLIVGSVLLIFYFRDLRINRKEGLSMLIFYFIYSIYIFLR